MDKWREKGSCWSGNFRCNNMHVWRSGSSLLTARLLLGKSPMKQMVLRLWAWDCLISSLLLMTAKVFFISWRPGKLFNAEGKSFSLCASGGVDACTPLRYDLLHSSAGHFQEWNPQHNNDKNLAGWQERFTQVKHHWLMEGDKERWRDFPLFFKGKKNCTRKKWLYRSLS